MIKFTNTTTFTQNPGVDRTEFLKSLIVRVDINAPAYWWEGFNSYEIGKCQNCTTLIGKLKLKEFTLRDFTWENMDSFSLDVLEAIIRRLNRNRDAFLRTNKQEFLQQIISLLPMSYNYTRTIQFTISELKTIYNAFRYRRPDEWYEVCKWIEQLPFFKEIIKEEN